MKFGKKKLILVFIIVSTIVLKGLLGGSTPEELIVESDYNSGTAQVTETKSEITYAKNVFRIEDNETYEKALEGSYYDEKGNIVIPSIKELRDRKVGDVVIYDNPDSMTPMIAGKIESKENNFIILSPASITEITDNLQYEASYGAMDPDEISLMTNIITEDGMKKLSDINNESQHFSFERDFGDGDFGSEITPMSSVEDANDEQTTVEVLGGVKKPRTVTVSKNMTLMDLVKNLGGFKSSFTGHVKYDDNKSVRLSYKLTVGDAKKIMFNDKKSTLKTYIQVENEVKGQDVTFESNQNLTVSDLFKKVGFKYDKKKHYIFKINDLTCYGHSNDSVAKVTDTLCGNSSFKVVTKEVLEKEIKEQEKRSNGTVGADVEFKYNLKTKLDIYLNKFETSVDFNVLEGKAKASMVADIDFDMTLDFKAMLKVMLKQEGASSPMEGGFLGCTVKGVDSIYESEQYEGKGPDAEIRVPIGYVTFGAAASSATAFPIYLGLEAYIDMSGQIQIEARATFAVEANAKIGVDFDSTKSKMLDISLQHEIDYGYYLGIEAKVEANIKAGLEVNIGFFGIPVGAVRVGVEADFEMYGFFKYANHTNFPTEYMDYGASLRFDISLYAEVRYGLSIEMPYFGKKEFFGIIELFNLGLFEYEASISADQMGIDRTKYKKLSNARVLDEDIADFLLNTESDESEPNIDNIRAVKNGDNTDLKFEIDDPYETIKNLTMTIKSPFNTDIDDIVIPILNVKEKMQSITLPNLETSEYYQVTFNSDYELNDELYKQKIIQDNIYSFYTQKKDISIINNYNFKYILNNKIVLDYANFDNKDDAIEDIKLEIKNKSTGELITLSVGIINYTTSFNIEGLDSNTEYEIRITGTIDIQDGNGPREEEFFYEEIVTQKENPDVKRVDLLEAKNDYAILELEIDDKDVALEQLGVYVYQNTHLEQIVYLQDISEGTHKVEISGLSSNKTYLLDIMGDYNKDSLTKVEEEKLSRQSTVFDTTKVTPSVSDISTIEKSGTRVTLGFTIRDKDSSLLGLDVKVVNQSNELDTRTIEVENYKDGSEIEIKGLEEYTSYNVVFIGEYDIRDKQGVVIQEISEVKSFKTSYIKPYIEFIGFEGVMNDEIAYVGVNYKVEDHKNILSDIKLLVRTIDLGQVINEEIVDIENCGAECQYLQKDEGHEYEFIFYGTYDLEDNNGLQEGVVIIEEVYPYYSVNKEEPILEDFSIEQVLETEIIFNMKITDLNKAVKSKVLMIKDLDNNEEQIITRGMNNTTGVYSTKDLKEKELDVEIKTNTNYEMQLVVKYNLIDGTGDQYITSSALNLKTLKATPKAKEIQIVDNNLEGINGIEENAVTLQITIEDEDRVIEEANLLACEFGTTECVEMSINETSVEQKYKLEGLETNTKYEIKVQFKVEGISSFKEYLYGEAVTKEFTTLKKHLSFENVEIEDIGTGVDPLLEKEGIKRKILVKFDLEDKDDLIEQNKDNNIIIHFLNSNDDYNSKGLINTLNLGIKNNEGFYKLEVEVYAFENVEYTTSIVYQTDIEGENLNFKSNKIKNDISVQTVGIGYDETGEYVGMNKHFVRLLVTSTGKYLTHNNIDVTICEEIDTSKCFYINLNIEKSVREGNYNRYLETIDITHSSLKYETNYIIKENINETYSLDGQNYSSNKTNLKVIVENTKDENYVHDENKGLKFITLKEKLDVTFDIFKGDNTKIGRKSHEELLTDGNKEMASYNQLQFQVEIKNAKNVNIDNLKLEWESNGSNDYKSSMIESNVGLEPISFMGSSFIDFNGKFLLDFNNIINIEGFTANEEYTFEITIEEAINTLGIPVVGLENTNRKIVNNDSGKPIMISIYENTIKTNEKREVLLIEEKIELNDTNMIFNDFEIVIFDSKEIDPDNAIEKIEFIGVRPKKGYLKDYNNIVISVNEISEGAFNSLHIIDDISNIPANTNYIFGVTDSNIIVINDLSNDVITLDGDAIKSWNTDNEITINCWYKLSDKGEVKYLSMNYED